jgi:hypothetical protein
MLENHVACDIVIDFPASGSGESGGRQVAAHKYMLISNSPVFEAMVSGSLKEGDQNISISDVEPDVFMELLK